MNRIILYNKDLQLRTGKSERTCYRMMNKIKRQIEKANDLPLTVQEFCEYMRIQPEVIGVHLKPRTGTAWTKTYF
jgi:hypothetical protein